MPIIPTPSEVEYMESHIDESLVPAINISNIICAVVAIAVVTLRLLARRHIRTTYGADDIVCVIALVITKSLHHGVLCSR